MSRVPSHATTRWGFQVAKVKRVVLLTVALVVLASLLVGCAAKTNAEKASARQTTSIEGTWVNENGKPMLIDKEWITKTWTLDPAFGKFSYTVAGESTLNITGKKGAATAQYILEGDKLTLSNTGTIGGVDGTYYREGSQGAKAAVSTQSDEQAKQACEKVRGRVTAAASLKWPDDSLPAELRGDYTALTTSLIDAGKLTGTADAYACPSGGTLTVKTNEYGGYYADCSVHSQ